MLCPEVARWRKRRGVCYSKPRWSGYFACKELTRVSNSGMLRKFWRQVSFTKNGQHANPLFMLRSNQSKATSRLPNKAKMQAI